jgi:hypothetical protein
VVAERATTPVAASPTDMATSTTGGTAGGEFPDKLDIRWLPAALSTSVTRLTSGDRDAAAQHRF